jgi:hypothetical protein
MLKAVGPMSNTERQRKFRERNPGYYGRLHARKRAGVKAAPAAKKVMAVATAPLTTKPLALPRPRAVLMLPAQGEIPVISGLNAIPAMHAAAAVERI